VIAVSAAAGCSGNSDEATRAARSESTSKPLSTFAPPDASVGDPTVAPPAASAESTTVEPPLVPAPTLALPPPGSGQIDIPLPELPRRIETTTTLPFGTFEATVNGVRVLCEQALLQGMGDYDCYRWIGSSPPFASGFADFYCSGQQSLMSCDPDVYPSEKARFQIVAVGNREYACDLEGFGGGPGEMPCYPFPGWSLFDPSFPGLAEIYCDRFGSECRDRFSL
jgi:hypothetical protein